MSKKSRKMKWKGVPLNHSNIDEYMRDLIEDTTGQYITQGVSFNKEDNFQMNLLKNSILAHGSFSGFVKNLLFAYFEKNGSIDESVWQPNPIDDEDAVNQLEPHNEELSTTDEDSNEEQQEEQEEQLNPVQTQTQTQTQTRAKPKKSKSNNPMLDAFINPQ